MKKMVVVCCVQSKRLLRFDLSRRSLFKSSCGIDQLSVPKGALTDTHTWTSSGFKVPLPDSSRSPDSKLSKTSFTRSRCSTPKNCVSFAALRRRAWNTFSSGGVVLTIVEMLNSDASDVIDARAGSDLRRSALGVGGGEGEGEP